MLIVKNYDNGFEFSKVKKTEHCCICYADTPEVVRENVVSKDVTIMSALRIVM